MLHLRYIYFTEHMYVLGVHADKHTKLTFYKPYTNKIWNVLKCLLKSSYQLIQTDKT